MYSRILFPIVALALVVAACSEGPSDLPPLDVAEVAIDPPTAALLVGDTLRLTALPKTADGQVLAGVDVVWASEAGQLATVAGSGVQGRVTAARAGDVVISATVAGKTGRAQLAISNALPTVAAVDPATVVAGSGDFTLVVRGAGFAPDSRIHWNEGERVTTYVNAGELRATISSGLISATGTVEVRVVSPAPGGGSSAPHVLTITPPPAGAVAVVEIDVAGLTLPEGEVAQLSAIARDANGTVVTGRFVQWRSSDAGIGHVAPLGEVSGIRAGTAIITATVDGASSSIPVHVTADYPYELVFAAWDQPTGWPRLYRVDLGDSTRTQAMIGPDAPAGAPAPSPDGSRIAFAGLTETGQRAVMISDIAGGNRATLLVTGDESCGVAWSPDGQKLALSCRLASPTREIWVMAADGTGLTNLTAGQAGHQDWPTWSPRRADGSYRIAYMTYVNGEPRIWSMADDGSDPRQVTSGMDSQPAWSPDGTTIAFQRTGAATFGDIWLADANGGNERSFVGGHLAGPQWGPVWSPDGRFLAFASTHETYGSGQTPVSQIYTVWTDGPQRLARRTTGDLDKHQPAWRVR